MSNELNEKLAKIFESFNDDAFLSNSEAETYGITIREYAQQHPDEVLNSYLNECLECIASYVDENTPTVEAIPVEWMKKFANEKALNDSMDGYWHFWGADLLQMIELWEKENGL